MAYTLATAAEQEARKVAVANEVSKLIEIKVLPLVDEQQRTRSSNIDWGLDSAGRLFMAFKLGSFWISEDARSHLNRIRQDIGNITDRALRNDLERLQKDVVDRRQQYLSNVEKLKQDHQTELSQAQAEFNQKKHDLHIELERVRAEKDRDREYWKKARGEDLERIKEGEQSLAEAREKADQRVKESSEKAEQSVKEAREKADQNVKEANEKAAQSLRDKHQMEIQMHKIRITDLEELSQRDKSHAATLEAKDTMHRSDLKMQLEAKDRDLADRMKSKEDMWSMQLSAREASLNTSMAIKEAEHNERMAAKEAQHNQRTEQLQAAHSEALQQAEDRHENLRATWQREIDELKGQSTILQEQLGQEQEHRRQLAANHEQVQGQYVSSLQNAHAQHELAIEELRGRFETDRDTITTNLGQNQLASISAAMDTLCVSANDSNEKMKLLLRHWGVSCAQTPIAEASFRFHTPGLCFGTSTSRNYTSADFHADLGALHALSKGRVTAFQCQKSLWNLLHAPSSIDEHQLGLCAAGWLELLRGAIQIGGLDDFHLWLLARVLLSVLHLTGQSQEWLHAMLESRPETQRWLPLSLLLEEIKSGQTPREVARALQQQDASRVGVFPIFLAGQPMDLVILPCGSYHILFLCGQTTHLWINSGFQFTFGGANPLYQVLIRLSWEDRLVWLRVDDKGDETWRNWQTFRPKQGNFDPHGWKVWAEHGLGW